MTPAETFGTIWGVCSVLVLAILVTDRLAGAPKLWPTAYVLMVALGPLTFLYALYLKIADPDQ